MAELVGRVGFDSGSAKKAGKEAGKAQAKESKKGIGVGGIAGGVALGKIFGNLLSSLDSIQSLLKVIGGLIDALVKPFVPILLTLLKPFLALFLFVGTLLAKWLSKAVKSTAGTATGIAGGAIGAGVGIAAGLGAGSIAALAAGLAAAGLIGFNLGDWLGEKFKEARFVEGFFDGITTIKKSFNSLWSLLKSSLSGIGDVWETVLNSFVTLGLNLKLGFQSAIDKFIIVLENAINGAIRLLNKLLPDFIDVRKVSFAGAARGREQFKEDVSQGINQTFVINNNAALDENKMVRLIENTFNTRLRRSGGF